MKLVFDVKDYNKIWFMSDLHIGHSNVIMYDKRPFADLKEMADYIKDEIESKVKENDIVFDLGDMLWNLSPEEGKNYIPKCKFYKILGNHDKEFLYRNSLKGQISGVGDIIDLTIKSGKDTLHRLVLCHYPMISWNHKARGSFMIHGHCHGNIDDLNTNSSDLRVDVGFGGNLCKSKKTFLISLEEIIDYFTEKIKPLTDFKEYVQQKGENL